MQILWLLAAIDKKWSQRKRHSNWESMRINISESVVSWEETREGEEIKKVRKVSDILWLGVRVFKQRSIYSLETNDNDVSCPGNASTTRISKQYYN